MNELADIFPRQQLNTIILLGQMLQQVSISFRIIQLSISYRILELIDLILYFHQMNTELLFFLLILSRIISFFLFINRVWLESKEGNNLIFHVVEVKPVSTSEIWGGATFFGVCTSFGPCQLVHTCVLIISIIAISLIIFISRGRRGCQKSHSIRSSSRSPTISWSVLDLLSICGLPYPA